jgi:hypothetical protein
MVILYIFILFAFLFTGIAKSGSQAIIATVFGNYMINVLTGLHDSNQVMALSTAPPLLLN